MTREEAKRRIDSIDFYLQHHTDDYSERDHDAMMMAISALEQIPSCNTCRYLDKNDCCTADRVCGADDFASYRPIMQQPCECVYSTKDGGCQYDDITEAIPPLEPCEDAVSFEAVCNIVNDIRDCISVKGYWAILERLKKLPSVTVRQSGEWIIYNYPAHECVYCSKCKTEYYENDLYLGGSEFPNFCPNCGCRMKG